MANAKSETQKEPQSEVALKMQGALTTNPVASFLEEDAGKGEGMGNATAESFAIPFLVTLQKGSPQVDESSGVAIEGAKSGMLFENVRKRMYDGKVGVVVVPCYYKRVFIHWGPKVGEGAGFKGELSPEQVAEMRANKTIAEMDGQLYLPLADGSVNDKKCDRIVDTRNHYVLILDDDGMWTQAVMSLASTQIKKSRMLMSVLDGMKIKTPSGPKTVATYGVKIRVQTVPESNEKGSWHGVTFTPEGLVDRAEVYAAGKAFKEVVAKGAVTVKYEATEPVAAEPEKKGF